MTTATGRRGRPVTGRPSANTTTAKVQVPADGDTQSHQTRAAALSATDRRLLLAVRTFHRWGTCAIGDAPGVTFNDSDHAWQVDVLAHSFALAVGSWGSTPHEAAA